MSAGAGKPRSEALPFVVVGDVVGDVVNVAFDTNTHSSGFKAPTTVGGPGSRAHVFYTEGGPEWIEFEVEIPITGEYRADIVNVVAQGTLWLEDHVEDARGRTRDLTGPIEIDHTLSVSGAVQPPFSIGRDGLALQKGTHLMRLYCSTPEFLVHGVRFTLTAEAPERD